MSRVSKPMFSKCSTLLVLMFKFSHRIGHCYFSIDDFAVMSASYFDCGRQKQKNCCSKVGMLLSCYLFFDSQFFLLCETFTLSISAF